MVAEFLITHHPSQTQPWQRFVASARALFCNTLFCNSLLDGPSHGIIAYMQSFTAVIERDEATGLFVGYVPGWPGAHSQGATLDELRQNLEEVVAMLLEDGAPKLEGEFVGTQTVKVA